jgi:hypothetical protein
MVAGLVLGSPAFGAYTLAPSVGGQSTSTVVEGQSIVIDLVLTRDNLSDSNTSAIFTVQFTKPGLILTNYAWAAPYTTGTTDDKSIPKTLPIPILSETYVAPFADAGTADVYFENFAISDNFTTGTLLTMTLSVPGGFGYGPITVSALPDTFDDGEANIVTAGQSATIAVVPEPTAVALGATVLSLILFRRRHH